MASGDAGPLKRPLSMASFAVNVWLSGMNPAAFKFTNLLIHLGNGVLVYLLTHQLLGALVATHSLPLGATRALGRALGDGAVAFGPVAVDLGVVCGSAYDQLGGDLHPARDARLCPRTAALADAGRRDRGGADLDRSGFYAACGANQGKRPAAAWVFIFRSNG
jgi:hypothetical protein